MFAAYPESPSGLGAAQIAIGVPPTMPAYDFRCSLCAEVFEITRSMTSQVKESCPSCGAPANRVFNSVGVAFKGTGFHNTDYKVRPKEATEAPATAAAAPACPAKAEGSSACASCPASE